jgi:hypothetical protein
MSRNKIDSSRSLPGTTALVSTGTILATHLLDFVTRLPPSKSFDTICVVVDHLTKQHHLIHCNTTITVKGLVELFCNRIFSYHGLLYPIEVYGLHPASGNTYVLVSRLTRGFPPYSIRRLMDRLSG